MPLIDDAGIYNKQAQQVAQPTVQKRPKLIDDAGIMTQNKEMGHPLAQFTKGLDETVRKIPLVGKAMDWWSPELKQLSAEVPAPQGTAQNLAKLAGQGLGYAPAFATGEGLVGAGASATAKLIGGGLGIGAQDYSGALLEGKGQKDALKEGGMSAAGTVIGGKVLGGAVKAIGNTTNAIRGASARISDWIVKLPKKAFSYSKDPMSVFTKENIVANTIGDYEKQAGKLLEQRVSELNNAVASNNKTVDIAQMFDDKIKKAMNLANVSLKDRTELINGINEFKTRVIQQYGNLSKITIQDAVKLKRQISDDFPFSALESKSSTNNLLSKIGHEVHHDINTSIEKVAPEITDLNQRVSGLIDIREAAKNRALIESRQNPIGLIGTLLGLGAAGGVYGQASGQNPIETGIKTALVAKALSSPFVLTRVAKALSKMADIDKINVLKAFPFLAKTQPVQAVLQPKQNVPSKSAPQTLQQLGLPKPLPQYLQQRQNAPIPSLGVKGNSTYIPQTKEPIPLKSPENVSRETPKQVNTLNDLVKKTPKSTKVAGGLTLAGLAGAENSYSAEISTNKGVNMNIDSDFKNNIKLLNDKLDKAGIKVKVVSGYRSPEEQRKLYSQGRTTPGKKVTNVLHSKHNEGMAVDFVVIKDNKVTYDPKEYKIIGEEAKKLGLVWGGDWKMRDYGHVEYKDKKKK